MYDRPTTRVLAVLELLQTRKRISGSELARRLDVDGRTVRRYIAALEDIGIPITAEQGRHGGYMLVSGFKLPPMMFTDDEALALSIGLLAARGLGVAETLPAVTSAEAKLERVMPEPIKHRLKDVHRTIQLDFSSRWPSVSKDTLSGLASAAHARRRVRLLYASRDADPMDRGFDPYGLSYRQGRWYAVGYCHLRRDLRTFRLDRVQAVTRLTDRFQRPEDFDVVDYLNRSFASIRRAHAIEILLLTDLETALQWDLGAADLIEPCDGGVLLRSSTDCFDFCARHLALLPFEFEVRDPPELARAVLDLAHRLERRAAIRLNPRR
ncbi:MAG TPA: YafY family protein [Woeseiaceae bacterium]|jgi:predicted DNA-binding transcriptional regulator YafY|nr:YafY family protein [Woeseiaceae bacterium]